MKIKLISPKKRIASFLDWKDPFGIRQDRAWAPPLVLPILAAITPSDIEISLVDENINEINFNEPVDLVGISFITPLANRAYEIADEFRRRGIVVILGGMHASMLPEEAIQHANSIVIGEAEDIWPLVVQDFKNKSLKKFYRCEFKPNLENIPIPRWDLINFNRYNFHILQVSRGCPYDCDFCSVKSFFGSGYRMKNIDKVIKEIKLLKELDRNKVIFFADDNLLGNREYAKDLFKNLMKLDIRWFCQSSINLAKHSELLELMHKSGCRQVFIGFESLSQESLNLMNKGEVNRSDEYSAAVDKIHSYGISVFGSFMLGNDGDDEGIFVKTIEFIDKTNIAFSLINIITPPPGTRLYTRLHNANRIIDNNWEKYNGEWVCFRPLKMSAEKLQEGHSFVLRELYSYDSIYKRLKSLWDKGLLIKKNGSILNKLNKERLFLTFHSLQDKNKKRREFILNSLWYSKTPAISPILMALSFYNFTFRKINKLDRFSKRGLSV